jgi:hypothetical protein
MRWPSLQTRAMRRLWYAFLAVLLACVAAELAIHRHSVFGIDGLFGFHAGFGFLACVALVLVAKLLGLVLKRPDSYYGD